jgi:hypothetical protein
MFEEQVKRNSFVAEYREFSRMMRDHNGETVLEKGLDARNNRHDVGLKDAAITLCPEDIP